MRRTIEQAAGADATTIAAIVRGENRDPFAFLGLHIDPTGAGLLMRTFQPTAERVAVIDAEGGAVVGTLDKVHDAGFFAGRLHRPASRFPYRLRLELASALRDIDDPYRFPSALNDAELHRFAAGDHLRAHELLGARRAELEGVEGVLFAVWAPNASRVSVVGPFNDWDGRRHAMRLHPSCGVWEIFIPGLQDGELYKYEIRSAAGELLPLKADPYGTQAERPPATASIVCSRRNFAWNDQDWMARRARANGRQWPMAIYEVHLGSWKRNADGRPLDYHALAAELVPYVRDMGFTHIELLPIAEHPFYGSWGYQPVGMFAPTSRFGTPDDFRHFVQTCHQAGIGVLIDWVSAHFPSDPHGLARFDGSHLYEHGDPRRGLHPDWNTLIYNFGRREVAAFLISNALYWIEAFHIDGLRVDAVASMLYLDYSRRDGEWLSNAHGGRENLEALALLRRLNEAVYAEGAGAITIAEESTAWPMVSRPTSLGGLGFGYKWNMGWMHDTLDYMAKDPVHRRHHHDRLTFGLLYAFHENFVLPLSHDEVVHGKGSLLGRMPGDRWQKFANLRLYYAFLYTQPGKKLLFMGGEFAQTAEWDHDRALDWHLLDDPNHRGVRRLVTDLNQLYRGTAALYELDGEAEGFEWIDCHDAEQSVISYVRRGQRRTNHAVVVCNFTPVVRHGYRIGVPYGGHYRERINTDACDYGGSGVGNGGLVEAEPVSWHGRPYSLVLTLPPLGALALSPEHG
jgi:1,4-alpha-glucan branching enzyme